MYPFIYILDRKIGLYGLCMALGFCLAGISAYRRGKCRGLLWEDLMITAATALGGALICGGALYICVTYSWEQIIDFIHHGDYRFLGSGIVFYGGLIGGILGALLGIRIAGCGVRTVERAVVPFVPLGHAIGRIGCVLAGCCHGFPYDGPLALHYPNSVLSLPPEQGYFPVQPLESLLNFGLCAFLLWYEKRARRTADVLFTYLGLYGLSRFFLEMLRGDSLRGLWAGLSTSQWISVLLLAVCLFRRIWIYFLHRAEHGNACQTTNK